MQKNNEVVKVSQLNKTFMSKNGVVKAIDNVSFSIREGEIVGLIGESGSGKTTIGRTLLRLHQADSGSILIDDKEYATHKIPKRRVRDLRNNAQMIFQDPYSSLNGQKNILNIVAEPLKVNKTDKKMVKTYLGERKDMLIFFKSTLNSFYWENEWKNIEDAFKAKIELSKNIVKTLKDLRFNEDDVKISIYNVVINTFYKSKIDANSVLVNKASDDLELYLNEWKNLKLKLDSEAIDDWDEIALLKAEKGLKLAEENLKGSKSTRELAKKIEDKKKEINNIKEEMAKMNAISNDVFLEILNKLKLEIKEAKINMPLARTYGMQNYLNLTSAKNKIVMDKVSKAAEQLRSIILTVDSNDLNESILDTTSELYGKLFETYKSESSDASVEFKKFSVVHSEISEIEWNENSKFDQYMKVLMEQNAKAQEEFNGQISKYQEELKALEGQYKENASKDSQRDSLELKNAVMDAKIQLEKAKKDNKNERINFSKKYTVDFAKTKEVREAKIETLKQEALEWESKAKESFEKKMAFINSLQSKYLLNEDEEKPSSSELAKLVKLSIKDKKDKNVALREEYKRLTKEKKIIRQLYGISNNVALAPTLKKFLVKMEVFSTLKHAGLQPAHAFRYPHEFSGGMRQRVGIARAIINKPKFIIADEPIAALDLSIQAQVVNMLLEQKERLGLAMLFIAHDLSMVRFNSDRILIMHLGKLVEYGETEEIFNNPKHPYTQNLIKTMPSLDNLAQGFEESTFIPEYLEPYSMSNKPAYVQVGSKDHFVLADKKQTKEWVGVSKSKPKTNSKTQEIKLQKDLQKLKDNKPEETKEEVKQQKEKQANKEKQTEIQEQAAQKEENIKKRNVDVIQKDVDITEPAPVRAPSVEDVKPSKPAKKRISKKYAPIPVRSTRALRNGNPKTRRAKTTKPNIEEKEVVAKPTTPKKATPAKKPVAKKTTPKKVVAKKPVAKKPAVKKATPKKTTTKKPVAKKATPAKKPVVKKSTKKVAANRRLKSTGSKKPTSRRSPKPKRSNKYSLK